jgi:hypothetical protein
LKEIGFDYTEAWKLARLWKEAIANKYTITRFPLVCKALHEITLKYSMFNYSDNDFFKSASKGIEEHYMINFDKAQQITLVDSENRPSLTLYFVCATIASNLLALL